MQKQKKNFKKILIAVFFGLIFLFVTFEATFAQWNITRYEGTNLPRAPLFDIIAGIAKWLLAIFGFIAIIGFVISGIIYLTSAGDEDRQEQAKRAMIYSITGVLVGLAGLVIIYAVDSLLKAVPF